MFVPLYVIKEFGQRIVHMLHFGMVSVALDVLDKKVSHIFLNKYCAILANYKLQ